MEFHIVEWKNAKSFHFLSLHAYLGLRPSPLGGFNYLNWEGLNPVPIKYSQLG